MATGFVIYQRLMYALILTAVFSFAWNLVSVHWIQVTVDRRTRRVRVGDDVEEHITIRNLSLLPKPELEVEDLTDLPGYAAGKAVGLSSSSLRDMKGFRASESWVIKAPARKRGVYSMGPIRVSNTDHFGLFRRDKLYGGTQPLIVYPRTSDLSGFPLDAGQLSGGGSRRRTHDIAPHASSVREYAFGDSISRVHWNSTARLGKLMSKEFDVGLLSEAWLLVDLARDVQAGALEESTDEYAVSIAASLAKRHLDAQLPVGLLAHGEERHFLPADTGVGQFDRILENLAVSKAGGSIPLEGAMAIGEPLWGFQSSLLVITPSPHMAWVTALANLAKRHVSVNVILLDSISFGGSSDSLELVPRLYQAGVPPCVVRRGDDISTALKQPYRRADLEILDQLEHAEVGT